MAKTFKTGMHKMPKSKTDKEQDMKLMRKMNPKQKAAFMKADKKMDAKKPSAKADMKMDKTLAKKVMYKKTGRGK
jgi:hypothetical protein